MPLKLPVPREQDIAAAVPLVALWIESKPTGFGPLFSADSGRLISATCGGGGTPPFVTHRGDGAGDTR
jgi:hypothetical protein